MPDVVYYVACSLDGFIATPDGGVDWLTPFQETGDDHGFTEFYSNVDALLMGSRTYEFALAHPPWMAPDKASWVFTTRNLEIADPSITLTSDEPAVVLLELNKLGIKRAWLMGGGTLAASFRNAGLITEYMIAIVPVILGDGIPLFKRKPKLDALDLVDTKTYPSGIVMLTYKSKPTG
jgi:dihydrofolate reductase